MPWLEATLLLLTLTEIAHLGLLLVLLLRLRLRLIPPIALEVARCAPTMAIGASSPLKVAPLAAGACVVSCHGRWELKGSATADR